MATFDISTGVLKFGTTTLTPGPDMDSTYIDAVNINYNPLSPGYPKSSNVLVFTGDCKDAIVTSQFNEFPALFYFETKTPKCKTLVYSDGKKTLFLYKDDPTNMLSIDGIKFIAKCPTSPTSPTSQTSNTYIVGGLVCCCIIICVAVIIMIVKMSTNHRNG
jgi:hypothetical protein